MKNLKRVSTRKIVKLGKNSALQITYIFLYPDPCQVLVHVMILTLNTILDCTKSI